MNDEQRNCKHEWAENRWRDAADRPYSDWWCQRCLLQRGDCPWVHITSVTASGVYGHWTTSCDPAGCAAGADGFYKSIDPAGIETGHVYEQDIYGKVIAEVEHD